MCILHICEGMFYMQISIAMIKDRLIQKDCDILIVTGKLDKPLNGLKLFEGKVLANFLNVGYFRDLAPFISEDNELIQYDLQNIVGITQDAYFIIDDQNLPRIFNTLLEAFQYYQSFESSLITAIANGVDIQGLLDIAEPYFDNPAFIANWHGEVFALTKSYKNINFRTFWSHIVDKHRLPFSAIQNLRNSPHYKALTQENTTSIFTFPNKDFTCVIGKLNTTHDYHLYLQVMQYKNTVTETTCILATALLDAIAHITQPKESTSLSELFCEMLDQSSYDTYKLDWALSTLGFESCEKFLLLGFWTDEGTLTSEVLCGELRIRMTRGYCFIWRGLTIMLIRENDLPEIKPELSKIINVLSFVCGVSMPFTCWDNLYVQFIQAEAASRYSKRNKRISFCNDHVWTYITAQLENILKVSKLCHPAVTTLADIDKKKNSKLLKTLYVYLANERSLSLTADKLFIHRNTLTQRLNRIENVVSINLDSVDVREHILLSCRMMKNISNQK
ncbi:MAG: PucR family transcriptional regulator [Eubacteriaceae bacterium]